MQQGMNLSVSEKNPNPKHMLKHHCLLDLHSSFFHLFDSLIQTSLTSSQKKVLRQAILLVKRLKLPSQSLILFQDEEGKVPKLSHLKELAMNVSFRNTNTIDFKSIHSVFGGIETLYLDLHLDKSARIRFTSSDVFSAMPQLQKLFIRIVKTDGWISKRSDLVSFLEILTDKRIVLNIDTRFMWNEWNDLDEPGAITAFDILGSELNEINKECRMNERLFMHFIFRSQISAKIFNISNQIHSIKLNIYERKESLGRIFPNLA